MSERASVALVTGASGGVGGAVTRALAGAGFHVVATGRSADALEEVSRPNGDQEAGTVRTVIADLCRPEDRRRLYETLRDEVGYGGLDVLVLSHGVWVFGMDEGASEEEVQGVFDTNFASRVLLFRELLTDLASRGGQVFEVNSTAALVPRSDVPLYAASMAGCASFFRSVGGAEGVYGHVRVCSIFLGRTDTRMQEEVARIESRPLRPDTWLRPESVGAFVAGQVLGPRDEDISSVVLRAAPDRTGSAAGKKES